MQGWGGTLGGSSRLSVSLSPLLALPLRRQRLLLLLGRAQTFLHPKATAERSGGRHSRSLPGSSCQVPARPGRAGAGAAAAAERGALGAGAAVPGGGAGLARGGGQRRGEALSPAPRPGRAPAVAPRRGSPRPGGGERLRSAPGPLQRRGELRCPAGAERRLSTFWRRGEKRRRRRRAAVAVSRLARL